MTDLPYQISINKHRTKDGYRKLPLENHHSNNSCSQEPFDGCKISEQNFEQQDICKECLPIRNLLITKEKKNCTEKQVIQCHHQ